MAKLFFGTLLIVSPAAMGCSTGAGDDAATQGAAYSDSTLLDHDTFSCAVSNGSTATVERWLSAKKSDPTSETLVQKVTFAESVFDAATKKLGAYGCAHDANEGWEATTFDASSGAKLPAAVTSASTRASSGATAITTPTRR